MKNESIKTVLRHFRMGSQNIKELWYDWFCKESSLVNKGTKLLEKLEKISKSKKFDIEKTYVFFKNNCPVVGTPYDDFRICDIETEDVLFTVVPKSGFQSHNGKGLIYSYENSFKSPVFEGTWKQIKEWFLKD